MNTGMSGGGGKAMWRRPYALIVWMAVFMHMSWAILVVYNQGPIVSTSLAPFRHFDYRVTSAILFSASLMAITCLVWPKANVYIPLLLLPQLIVLFTGAMSALTSGVEGRFPDGVMRPWQFIMADQLPYVFIAIAYMIVVGFIFSISIPHEQAPVN